MMRYNQKNDEQGLSEYEESDGKVAIYIAVTLEPTLHWRIVWKRVHKKTADTQGWCDVEIMVPREESSREYQFRFSIRKAGTGTSKTWKLFFAGELNKESRLALPVYAAIQDPAKLGDHEMNCDSCVKDILKALSTQDVRIIDAGTALDSTTVAQAIKNAERFSGL